MQDRCDACHDRHPAHPHPRHLVSLPLPLHHRARNTQSPCQEAGRMSRSQILGVGEEVGGAAKDVADDAWQ